METPRADSDYPGAVETDQGSAPPLGGRDAVDVPANPDLPERISGFIRAAEEAQAILDDALQLADCIRREADDAAAATRAAAEEEARQIREAAARDLSQLAEDVARLSEERWSRLASDIEPGEPMTRGPTVAALASGSASASAHERTVERMIELAIAIVLSVAIVAAMVALLVVLE
jgi:hypothetical protein